MTDITETQAAAVRRALSLNLPFALFAFPGDTDFRFFASWPDPEAGSTVHPGIEGDTFVATRFTSPIADGVAIPPSMTAEDVLALPEDTPPLDDTDMLPAEPSTPYRDYYAMLRKAIASMRRHSMDKVVLSRVIAATTGLHPVELASAYFAQFPDTFRAMFFTRETGLWLTASPEILLKETWIDHDTDVTLVESLALAGTRPAGSDGDWDSKNTTEHNIVLSHITDAFRKVRLCPSVEEDTTVLFGDIEHRAHRIWAIGIANTVLLAEHLSPTPALAGYPVDKAIRFIADNEPHYRGCYGGNLGLVVDNVAKLYVNVRCAQLSPYPALDGTYGVNIFAGGGIMPASVIPDEWREAASKAMPLYRIIDPDGASSILDIPERWQAL